MPGDEVIQLPADTMLSDELTADELVEMANLTTAQTGVPGPIFISTAMVSHGPRVKYYVQPGRTQPSFSVTVCDSPTVAANSLPVRVLRQMSPPVIQWVSLNQTALSDFWTNGDTWTQPQVEELVQMLKPI